MGVLSFDAAIGMTLRGGGAVLSKSSDFLAVVYLGLVPLFDKPHT